MKVCDLSGMSGCTIELHRNLLPQVHSDSVQCTSFVRKISRDLQYNSRLRSQSLKQSLYLGACFETPAVLFDGYLASGHFYFDMEFIDGSPLNECFGTISRSLFEQFLRSVEEVCQCPPLSHRTSVQRTFNTDRIHAKLKTLEDSFIKREEGLGSAMDLLSTYAWPTLARTECHGDLTFENVIAANGKFHAVDFLDSCVESWLVDVAKLLQDAEIFWSFRHSNITDEVRLRCASVRATILQTLGTELFSVTRHLLLFNLLRILPYVSGSGDRTFLLSAIGNLSKSLRGEKVREIPTGPYQFAESADTNLSLMRI